MAQQKISKNDEITRLVLEEVDEARETLELVSQLVSALPLKGMADVAKAMNGKITFRGNTFAVEAFVGLVPEILFPIDDPEKLVRLAYQVVLAAPSTITYDMEDPVIAKREMQRAVLRRLVSDGGLGPMRRGYSPVFGAMGDRSKNFSTERKED